MGNLEPSTTERELEDEFRTYGVLRSVWVARKPPGYAFIEFDDKRDAVDAIRSLDGKNGWRVEMSRSTGGGARGRGGDNMNCFECGEPGHFARECRLRIGPGGLGSGIRGRSRSPPPRYRRSPSYGRRYSPPSRRSRSPRRGSISPAPHRGRTPSRSPPVRRGRRGSSYTNESPPPRERYRSPSASP